MCRSVIPFASGPNDVSCIGTIAAANSDGSTPTGHQTECSRICDSSSAARSAANGSAVSNTACTNVPNFAPAGRSAIGDGTSGPDAGWINGISATSSSSSTTSGSLLTPLVSAARIRPEYDVRRQVVSIARSKGRTENSTTAPSSATAAGGGHHRLLDHRPAAVSHFASRAIASSSEIFAGTQRSGTVDSPGSRPRSKPRQPAVGLVIGR